MAIFSVALFLLSLIMIALMNKADSGRADLISENQTQAIACRTDLFFVLPIKMNRSRGAVQILRRTNNCQLIR